jgi:IS30 family transposase
LAGRHRPSAASCAAAELQEIVLSHNLTPRKCLGFLTPLQALLGELGKDVQIRFA